MSGHVNGVWFLDTPSMARGVVGCYGGSSERQTSMANQTVTIGPTAITYTPDPPVVRPGDTVDFVLDGRTDKVQVVFTSGTPFTQATIDLDGSSPLSNSQEPTVTNSVTTRRYYFDAVPKPPHPLPPKHDPEPPGTLGGGLDVTTEF